MTFTLLRGCNKDSDGYINIPVKEKILNNESVGDQIGLEEKTNLLWVHEDIDLYNDDVLDFIDNFFTSGARALQMIQNSINQYSR